MVIFHHMTIGSGYKLLFVQHLSSTLQVGQI